MSKRKEVTPSTLDTDHVPTSPPTQRRKLGLSDDALPNPENIKSESTYLVDIEEAKQCANKAWGGIMTTMKVVTVHPCKLDPTFFEADDREVAHCESCTCHGPPPSNSMQVAIAHMFGVSETGEISLEAADIYVCRDGALSVGGGGGGKIQPAFWIPSERQTNKYDTVVFHYLPEIWEEICRECPFVDKTSHSPDKNCAVDKPCPVDVRVWTPMEGGGLTTSEPPDIRCPTCYQKIHYVWNTPFGRDCDDEGEE